MKEPIQHPELIALKDDVQQMIHWAQKEWGSDEDLWGIDFHVFELAVALRNLTNYINHKTQSDAENL